MIEENDDMCVSIFSPEGITPMLYRREYPDLLAIREFEPLNDYELIMIWHYANPTSPLVYSIRDKEKRMAQAYRLTNPEVTEEKSAAFAYEFVNGSLVNAEILRDAAERMSRISPDVRRQADKMVNRILSDYMGLLDRDLDEFVKGDGDTDFTAYTMTRQRIVAHLDLLIQKVETGFGTKKASEKKLVGEKIPEKYLKQKANAGNSLPGNVSTE